MPIVLFRLDERLIHGQVVVGWVSYLRAHRLVILNDRVASTPWEKELYLACVPPELKASIFSLEEGFKKISNAEFEKENIMVLLDNPLDLLRLVKKGVKISEVNVGGMHFKDGRKQILPYIYLTAEEIAIFKELFQLGTSCFCQDVPTAEKKDLKRLLEKLSFGYTMP
ncbi:MAG: hypothetical protein A2145_05500 [candidate division Zixibacteria bacterium RBG_16_40_9]|nr:MAG: hypothetical protein A2145_05500 [candidate division Zixibacteria bacterium RBG_16_40_9]